MYDSAIADFSDAIRINPINSRGYFDRGWTYFYRLNQVAKACSDFDKSCSLDEVCVYNTEIEIKKQCGH